MRQSSFPAQRPFYTLQEKRNHSFKSYFYILGNWIGAWILTDCTSSGKSLVLSFCPAFAGSLLHIGQLQDQQNLVLHEKAKRAAIPISIKKIQ